MSAFESSTCCIAVAFVVYRVSKPFKSVFSTNWFIFKESGVSCSAPFLWRQKHNSDRVNVEECVLQNEKCCSKAGFGNRLAIFGMVQSMQTHFNRTHRIIHYFHSAQAVHNRERHPRNTPPPPPHKLQCNLKVNHHCGWYILGWQRAT